MPSSLPPLEQALRSSTHPPSPCPPPRDSARASPPSSKAQSVLDEKSPDSPVVSPVPFSPASSTAPTKWKRGKGFKGSFTAICIPILLSALEGSVTNTALPTISDALDLGTKSSWVATAFLLSSTVPQPLLSQLGNIYGRKYPMMVAVLVFATGSAICGGANNGATLILGRALQGIGTGGCDLYAEMVLCDITPLRSRGAYTAIKHAVYAVGTALGPVLGGVFAERNWRLCFYINLPVCALALVVMWFWLAVGGGVDTENTSVKEELKKIDYAGSVLLTVSVILILVALSTGGAPTPWSSAAVIAPMVLGFLGLAAFAFWERSPYCKHPVMPPEVFSNRTTNIAFGLTTLHGFVTYGFQFFLPIFFQAVKGSSPKKSGLEVLPTTVAIVVCAALGGPMLSWCGRYKLMHIVGFGITMVGFFLCTRLNSDTSVAEWFISQAVTAFGLGMVISTMLPSVQAHLPESTTGASAGAWAFLRGTGSLFGVAIPSAVFNARFAVLLDTIPSAAARAKLENGQAYQRATAAFTNKFGAEAKVEIVRVFKEALKSVWFVFAALVVVAFVLTWFEREHELRTSLDSAYGLKPASKNSSPASSEGSESCDSTPSVEMVVIQVEGRDAMDMVRNTDNVV